MSKHAWQQTEHLLHFLRDSLGSDVFDFTVRRNGRAREVLFKAHPTVDGERPTLKALAAHANGTRPLALDPVGFKPEPRRPHWASASRSTKESYGRVWPS